MLNLRRVSPEAKRAQKLAEPLWDVAAESTLYVWRCDLDVELTLPDSLDNRERARAAAFKFDRDRRRYIQAHRFLRFILSKWLERDPAAIEFEISSHGKPALKDRQSPAFNMSHADHVAYVALMERGPLGIDVELDHEVVDAINVGRTVYSPSEMLELTAAEPGARSQAFLRCWTRKESYLKALGLGIGEPDLPSITVGTQPQPISLGARPNLSDLELHIRTLVLRPDEHVAVATAIHFIRIEFTDLTSTKKPAARAGF